MSSVVLSGDSSGTVTLTVPSAAGTNTATLPAATGTVMVSGNMPAFSAYLGSNQSTSVSTWTKIQCNTEEFDTNSNYDNSTNYRFTPTVAGYYQVNAVIQFASGSGIGGCAIYKNGASFKFTYLADSNGSSVLVSALIYCNGSTDYLEMYSFQNVGTVNVSAGANATFFQATMVRGS